MMKPAAFYIPVNYDLNSLPDEYRAHAAYLLNLIHWKTCCWKADEEGFVRLKYDYLTKIIPRNLWKKLIFGYLNGSCLGYPEVIELHASSVQGVRCYGYRLAPEYRATRRIVCTNVDLNRKIRNLSEKQDKNLVPVHRWLRDKFDRLDFDLDRAREIISGQKSRRRRRGFTPGVAEYRRHRLEYCLRIANKDHWFTVDQFGRVHTPITALERDLRCCLTVGGQPLVGIDLKNSQPLFLGILARRYFASRVTRSRLLNKSFDGRRNPYCPQEVKATAIVPECDLPSDEREFLRVCEDGTFYESLMTDQERARGKNYRGRFKKRFYRFLFGRNRRRGRYPNEIRDRFRVRYPSVAEVVWALKTKNYRHSSHVLQNYEATLFVCQICGRVMRERPDLDVYTIHDSLLTPPGAVPFVESVIRDEFRKLGISPGLKREDYRK